MSGKPAVKVLATLDGPGAGNWQGSCKDLSTGHRYIVHSRASHLGGSAEDVHIYGFNTKGKRTGEHVLVDAGHTYGFGVIDGVIWIAWDDSEQGNDIVTIPFKPGAVSKKSDAEQMHVFTDEPAQISFSPTRTACVIMTGPASHRTFTQRLTKDVLNNKDDVQGKPVETGHPGVLQGFSSVGRSLYLLYGSSNEKAWIEKWSFNDGKKRDVFDITDVGFLPGEPSGKREPEGMDGRTFGIKIYEGDARRLRVFELVNF
jgi:hypothetical protein